MVAWAALVVVGAPEDAVTAVLVGPVVADAGVVDETGSPDVVAAGETVLGATELTAGGAVVDASDCAPTERAGPRTVPEVTATVTRSAVLTRRVANRWFIGDIERLVSEAWSFNTGGPSKVA